MDKLSFVVQAKDSKDLGHVSLIRDELVQFFAVRDSTHTFIQRYTIFDGNLLQISR